MIDIILDFLFIGLKYLLGGIMVCAVVYWFLKEIWEALNLWK